MPGVLRADNLIVWFVPVALPSGAKEATIVYALEDFPALEVPVERRRQAIPKTCGAAVTCSSTTRRKGGSARSRWGSIASSWGCV